MENFSLDFIGVGSPKAGTDWLSRCLAEHPQIAFSTPKELDYFLNSHFVIGSPSNYYRGKNWLKNRFPGWRIGQLRGEFSVSYLSDPISPKMIYGHNPEARLIISYRNPVESIYSMYFQYKKIYPISEDFDRWIESYPEIKNIYFHFRNTMRYLELFSRDQIHMILYDEIKISPANVIESLYEFLGIDSAFVPPSIDVRINVRTKPRSVLLRNVLGGSIQFFRTNRIGTIFAPLLRKFYIGELGMQILKNNQKPGSYYPMEAGMRADLTHYYEKDILSLANLMKRDLTHWLTQ